MRVGALDSRWFCTPGSMALDKQTKPGHEGGAKRESPIHGAFVTHTQGKALQHSPPSASIRFFLSAPAPTKRGFSHGIFLRLFSACPLHTLFAQHILQFPWFPSGCPLCLSCLSILWFFFFFFNSFIAAASTEPFIPVTVISAHRTIRGQCLPLLGVTFSFNPQKLKYPLDPSDEGISNEQPPNFFGATGN